MHELMTQLLAVGRGMWKHRWYAVLVAWLVAIVGVVVVWRIPLQYEASARIFVDTQTILKPLMAGLAVQPNVQQQVTMLSRTLISRPNVEKLVRMADLDLDRSSKAEREALVEDLTKRLQIRSTGRDNLYTLSFTDADPGKAQRAIQSLVSIFVESSLGATRSDAASAKVFLDDQIKSYRAKLEEAEARLKEFRLSHLDLQYGPDGKDAAGRMAEITAQLNQARLELREAENARQAAKAALETEKGRGENLLTQSLLQESNLNVSTPELDARLDAQRRNLDALLQRFTDRHPDVLATRRVIEELEEEKRQKVEELRKAAMAAPTPTPVSTGSLAAQELSRVLASAEVQVAALRARVAEYTGRYERARAALRTAPQIEAEAARLNRDYAVHKKNYEDLVARRESAVMSGELDNTAGMADFRLIDPPRVSQQPVSPNRLQLLPLVLAAALGAGVFTAFALNQLRPVFHTAAELRHRFDLPLLGTVSLVLTDAERRRGRADLVRFWLASGSLVCLFVAGMTVLTVTGGR